MEQHLGALGAPDPVALHRQHALWPVLEQRHVVQEALCILGDREVPLRERATLDQRAAALAVAVDDLLVGEHGLVDRAPVDRGLALVGQPALEQQQEDPLRPAVVLGFRGRQLARPVDRPAHALHLLADRGDVVVRDVARVAALADRRVLGRQAEGVVPHRVQHAQAVAAALMTQRIADRVVLDMPHVQIAGGVGQHLEHVLGARAILPGPGVRGDEGLRVLPDLLPLGLDRCRVVALHCSPCRRKRLHKWKRLSVERRCGSSVGTLRAAVRSAQGRRSARPDIVGRVYQPSGGRSMQRSPGAAKPKRAYNPCMSLVCRIQRRCACGPFSTASRTSSTPSPRPR